MIKTITIQERHTEDSEYSIYINSEKYTKSPHVIEDFNDHFIRVHVECTKGTVYIGRVFTNFCQDINKDLTLQEQKEVYANRLCDAPTRFSNPYTYRPNSDNESHYSLTSRIKYDERFNIRENNKLVDLSKVPEDEPEHFSRIGWWYELLEGDILDFDVNILVPEDFLQFAIDHNLPKEFFNEIFSTRR